MDETSPPSNLFACLETAFYKYYYIPRPSINLGEGDTKILSGSLRSDAPLNVVIK